MYEYMYVCSIIEWLYWRWMIVPPVSLNTIAASWNTVASWLSLIRNFFPYDRMNVWMYVQIVVWWYMYVLYICMYVCVCRQWRVTWLVRTCTVVEGLDSSTAGISTSASNSEENTHALEEEDDEASRLSTAPWPECMWVPWYYTDTYMYVCMYWLYTK